MAKLKPDVVTPLFPLRRPLTNVMINEQMSHVRYDLEVGGQYSGTIAVANGDRKEFAMNILADTTRDVGYVFAGVITWRNDPRNLSCSAVVDEDGNVHDINNLKYEG